MKINEIKINAYGNIENKKINLEHGINIIHGSNESGKSTLLNYIVSSFYGISKNKEGREVADYDQYKPWNNEEFSGRISYELDNKEKYEVFRNFNKKNPKLYNSQLEDITNQYEIDKKDGSKFFINQTGVDKQMYLSTVVSMQQEVRLDDKNQNMLIQKIANLAGTGEDNVSYKKALTKLQDKIRDEIGTNKTTQKPLNIIEKELVALDIEIAKIKEYQTKQFDINTEKEKLIENIKELELEKEILVKLQDSINKENIGSQRIEIDKNIVRENTNKIQSLRNEKNEYQSYLKKVEEEQKKNQTEKENKEIQIEKLKSELLELENNKPDKDSVNIKQNKNIKSQLVLTGIVLVMVIFISISLIVLKNKLAIIPFIVIMIISITTYVMNRNKQKTKLKQDNDNAEKTKIKNEKEGEITELCKTLKNLEDEIDSKNNVKNEYSSKESMVEGQIQLLEKNNESLTKEIEDLINNIENILQHSINKISNEYFGKIESNKLNSIININNVTNQITILNNEVNDEKIRLKGVELEEQTIIPYLERLVVLKEQQEADKQKYKELKAKEEVINIAIKSLQTAYEKMKSTVTPKFSKNLSSSIEKISNLKYLKVNINDETGMMVENTRGEYIEASKLSTGTIDQLYLSLRLSMIDELAREKMPILLDETFAYFDNERLENSLQYLHNTLNGHQVIIFTCTNREKEILDKLKISYNLAEM